jgi:hypothetical protein
MTEKSKFQAYLRKNGFHVSEVLSRLDYIPHHYIDWNKNHNLISNISVCIFTGSTPGYCITFCFGGIQRKYRQKYINERAEICKKVFVCKTAKQAIKEYNIWHKTALEQLNSMKVIL